MKMKFVFLLALTLGCAQISHAQFSFSASPGLSFNSASVGYKINNKILPFAGIQYFNINMKSEQSGKRFDPQMTQIIAYSEKDVFSLNLLVPNIGVKCYVMEKNKLRSSVVLNIAKPMISGKQKNNGETDNDFKKEIKAMKMWAGEIGFGTEYFFDDNFSVGGEFGLRNFFYRSKTEEDETIYNPYTNSYEIAEEKRDTKIMANPTYTRIALNFYF